LPEKEREDDDEEEDEDEDDEEEEELISFRGPRTPEESGSALLLLSSSECGALTFRQSAFSIEWLHHLSIYVSM